MAGVTAALRLTVRLPLGLTARLVARLRLRLIVRLTMRLRLRLIVGLTTCLRLIVRISMRRRLIACLTARLRLGLEVLRLIMRLGIRLRARFRGPAMRWRLALKVLNVRRLTLRTPATRVARSTGRPVSPHLRLAMCEVRGGTVRLASLSRPAMGLITVHRAAV